MPSSPKSADGQGQSSLDFAHLFEAAPDGILIVDAGGMIVSANGRAAAMFGYPASEMRGQSVEKLLPERFRETHAGHRHNYMAAPAVRPMGIGLDLVARRKGGQEIPVEISLSPVADESGKAPLLVIAIVRDVTEQRRLEQERQRLGAQLEIERERYRIGMELHDGIMQSVYAVSLTLELAAANLVDGEAAEARRDLDRAIERLHGVVRDIRSYIFDLRPREFAGDLSAALLNLTGEFSQNSQIETETDICSELPRFAEPIGVALYQVAHEALSNIQRHAPAARVRLKLETSGQALRLEVSDDGPGFDPAGAQTEAHRGLRNMRRRLEAVGGRLTLSSAPGAGTSVVAEAPLDGATNRDPAS